MKRFKKISGHLTSVYSVNFPPGDTKLISCSRDTTIRIWDFNGSKEIAMIKTEGRGLASVDISPDGKSLIANSMGVEIVLYRTE